MVIELRFEVMFIRCVVLLWCSSGRIVWVIVSWLIRLIFSWCCSRLLEMYFSGVEM